MPGPMSRVIAPVFGHAPALPLAEPVGTRSPPAAALGEYSMPSLQLVANGLGRTVELAEPLGRQPTLADLQAAVAALLEPGTWLAVEHDDVEPLMPLYSMSVAGPGPFHRFFIAPASAASAAATGDEGGDGSDVEPCLVQVRKGPLLSHRPTLSHVPAAPFLLGVAALRVWAWTPGHQQIRVEHSSSGGGAPTMLLVRPESTIASLKQRLEAGTGLAVGSQVLIAHNQCEGLDLAEREILCPDGASLADLGVTPAWWLELQQGPMDCSMRLSVVLPSGRTENVYAAPGMKVCHLKHRLIEAACVPARSMRLVLRGRMLKDLDTLAACGLQRGDTVLLTLSNNLAGGYKTGGVSQATLALLPCQPLMTHAVHRQAHRLIEVVHPDGALEVVTCPADLTVQQLKEGLQAHWAGGQAASRHGSIRLVNVQRWQREQEQQQQDEQQRALEGQQREEQQRALEGQQREQQQRALDEQQREEEQQQQEGSAAAPCSDAPQPGVAAAAATVEQAEVVDMQAASSLPPPAPAGGSLRSSSSRGGSDKGCNASDSGSPHGSAGAASPGPAAPAAAAPLGSAAASSSRSGSSSLDGARGGVASAAGSGGGLSAGAVLVSAGSSGQEEEEDEDDYVGANGSSAIPPFASHRLNGLKGSGVVRVQTAKGRRLRQQRQRQHHLLRQPDAAAGAAQALALPEGGAAGAGGGIGGGSSSGGKVDAFSRQDSDGPGMPQLQKAVQAAELPTAAAAAAGASALSAPQLLAATERLPQGGGPPLQQAAPPAAAAAPVDPARTVAALAAQLSDMAAAAARAAAGPQPLGALQASLEAVQQLMALLAPTIQACSSLLAVAAAAAAAPPVAVSTHAGCQAAAPPASSSAGMQTAAAAAATAATAPVAHAQVQTDGFDGVLSLRGQGQQPAAAAVLADAGVQTDRPEVLKVCACCGRTPLVHVGVSLKKCRGCQGIYYCNAQCQQQDWSAHKPYCDTLMQLLRPW